MIKIFIDFETYSEADLKNISAHKYAKDKTTEVLCIGYAFDDSEPKIWFPGMEAPKDLFLAIKNGGNVYAWNTEFEFAIWKYNCIKKLNWPEVPFTQWRDIQAIVSTFSWPLSLKECGKAMGLNVQKDQRGEYLLKKLSKPQKPTKNFSHIKITKEISPDLFEELYEYCLIDVKAELEIFKNLPWELQENELNLWRETIIKNDRGIPIDIELVDNVIDKVSEYLYESHSVIPQLTNNYVKTINQGVKIIEWAHNEGYALKDFTAETIQDALKDPNIENFPRVKYLLAIRSETGKSSIKKFNKLKEATCTDNRIRGCLKYHKATTGREGGRLLQPQNLPRASVGGGTDEEIEEAISLFLDPDLDKVLEKYDDVIKTASALIRPSICAEKGKKLIVSDYSSIELLVVCWLAGQDDVLQKFELGTDLYIDMASDLYGIDYKDISEDSKMRKHGKLTMLGGIYGMGWKTFKNDCIIKQNFPITDEEAKRTINIFREKNNMVKLLWSELMKNAILATKNPEKLFTYGIIRFIHVYNYLFMILPNGKYIAYPGAKLDKHVTPWGAEQETIFHMGTNTYTKKWERLPISPGRLTENATQGTAREILMEATLDLERAGYPVILTVHDEVVIEVPENFGSLDEVNKILCDRSEYFSGLPLKAKGFEGKRYHK